MVREASGFNESKFTKFNISVQLFTHQKLQSFNSPSFPLPLHLLTAWKSFRRLSIERIVEKWRELFR